MRDSTKELIALMQQENGVTEFQCASASGGKWRDCNNPLAPVWSSPNTNFRVKTKLVEVWTWNLPNNDSIGQDFHNKNCQNFYNKKQPDDKSGRVMILLREVTE